MEIKPNGVSLRWNFYADIQLIRGRFWLRLWTAKSSESHASRENTLLRCGKIRKCHRRLQQGFVDGRTEVISRAFRFAIRIDSPIHFKRIDSNRFVLWKIGLSIHYLSCSFSCLFIAVSAKSHLQHNYWV